MFGCKSIQSQCIDSIYIYTYIHLHSSDTLTPKNSTWTSSLSRTTSRSNLPKPTLPFFQGSGNPLPGPCEFTPDKWLEH